ncbi:MAG: S-methyl-5'-thioinosine phosphorylase [Pseudomonadales bacterium]
MSSRLALVAGSTPLPDAAQWQVKPCPANAYGRPSGPLRQLADAGSSLYLPRHDETARIAPHAINYRANVEALHAEGVTHALCSYSVGGVDAALAPGTLVIADQLIDYTWGRKHSFFDADAVTHAEFASPVDPQLTELLRAAAAASGIDVVCGGTYACTQGPRLETAAEVSRLDRDGCTLVGMTAMPELALLRERGIAAATLCLVVNPAAGVVPGAVDMQALHAVAKAGAAQMQRLLLEALSRFVSA